MGTAPEFVLSAVELLLCSLPVCACPCCFRLWTEGVVGAGVGVSGEAVGVAVGGVGGAFEEAAHDVALVVGELGCERVDLRHERRPGVVAQAAIAGVSRTTALRLSRGWRRGGRVRRVGGAG